LVEEQNKADTINLPILSSGYQHKLLCDPPIKHTLRREINNANLSHTNHYTHLHFDHSPIDILHLGAAGDGLNVLDFRGVEGTAVCVQNVMEPHSGRLRGGVAGIILPGVDRLNLACNG